jgi:8-amino-7-oxononanoate synthase
LAALKILGNESWRHQHLQALIERFRAGMAEWQHCLLPSHTAIQPVVVGDAETALQLSDFLAQQGILVSAIRPPTVPAGTARLRITLTAAHSEQHVDQLIESLQSLLPVVMPPPMAANDPQ